MDDPKEDEEIQYEFDDEETWKEQEEYIHYKEGRLEQ